MTIEEIIRQAGQLPASHIAQEVNQTLDSHSTLVVTAPPGAGKSTLLPLTMMMGGDGKGKILMLEPRRLAAKQIAERMAAILGEPVGKTVGYRVRFETKVSADTRIEVLTEGILTRMLVDDATLEGVDTVVFDEFHERSINSDLALALCRQSQQLIRPDMKILIMSATIDASHICQVLQAPLIESEGKMYPVDIKHSEEDMDMYHIAKTVSAAVLKAYREHEGDILAFLPGQGEIEQCQELLQPSIPHVYPLYGNLSPERQRQAIAPSGEGERKVVLATPIAETSLTIEGVRIVIDSGLCRRLVFDGRTGLSRLETVRISMDMATQRMGRAGRVAEGVCYRLWTLATEHRMEEQRKPEVMEADLASMVLDIYAFGENDIASLPWLDLPPMGNVAKAEQLLVSLGALRADQEKEEESSYSITSLGRKMVQLPCHPRIARMILGAKDASQRCLACDIAALLEEKDPMSESGDSDMVMRLSVLRGARRKKNLGRWNRIAQIAKEYQRMACATEDNGEVDAEAVGMLVAFAYPERIAKAMDNIGTFRLASGDVVRIEASDSMYAHQWLSIASMNSAGGNGANGTNGANRSAGRMGRVFLAAPLNVESVEDLMTEQDYLSWDGKQGCVVMQREQRIGKIIVSSKPIHDANPEDIVRIICEAVKKDGLSMFDWNEQVQRLQRRVAQVALWHPELGIPDISTEHLMETASEWLLFYISQQGKVKSSIADLKKLDLQEILWAIVPYDLQQEIDRLAPTHIQVPTGSRIRVDYRLSAEAPVLSVRLQECFGLQATPCVNDGKQPVLMELLSPGFKPVQLTQDLGSFWQNTYFEVRKELKRRYPKHSWPENPLEAEAVRGVKRK